MAIRPFCRVAFGEPVRRPVRACVGARRVCIRRRRGTSPCGRAGCGGCVASAASGRRSARPELTAASKETDVQLRPVRRAREAARLRTADSHERRSRTGRRARQGAVGRGDGRHPTSRRSCRGAALPPRRRATPCRSSIRMRRRAPASGTGRSTTSRHPSPRWRRERAHPAARTCRPARSRCPNEKRLTSYSGAAPPPATGTHRYFIVVTALDVPHLDIPEGATPAVLGFNAHFHAVARGILVGTASSD